MRLQLDTILALFQIPTNALGTLLLRVITFVACWALAQKSMWILVGPVLVVGYFIDSQFYTYYMIIAQVRPLAPCYVGPLVCARG